MNTKIIKSWIRVRLAFIKNTCPQNLKYLLTYFKSVSYEQVLVRDILLLSHSLEKGLCYTTNIKPQWGGQKASTLLSDIEYLLNNGFDSESYEIVEAISVLDAYLKVSDYCRRDELSTRLKNICEQYKINHLYAAGMKLITKETLFNYNDVASFIKGRRSIRFFKHGLVSENDIIKAVDIANCAPSACNRQPSVVYYSLKEESISKLGAHFKTAYSFDRVVPQILVVTSKLSLFSSDEYLQPLINGGIYVSYLCMAFHSLNIGTTPLEMNAFKGDEKDIRTLLKIGRDEIIVCALAIGYVKEENNITCASRKQAQKNTRSF